ncbi:hypothetical protein [Oceanobacillus jeddahense]|uniref:hypothetical protein n=1 Tax=Oceanobacillus jeddahense TaxID=1462527 RepID=UPI000595BDCE|nr:hypothetical protein [Oceanobacillus jeddahense]
MGTGIIVRRINGNNAFRHLILLIKGTTVLYLLFIINNIFMMEMVNTSEVIRVTAIYFILQLVFVFAYVKNRKSNRLEGKTLFKELNKNYDVNSYEEIKQLDKRLAKQLRTKKKFVTHKGQIAATDDFMLMEMKDQRFFVWPTAGLKEISVRPSQGEQKEYGEYAIYFHYNDCERAFGYSSYEKTLKLAKKYADAYAVKLKESGKY